MKSRILLFPALFTLVVGASCLPEISSAENDPARFSLRASAPAEDGDAYDYWCNSWSQPGHIYFHYNRGTKDDYKDFCLWIWNDTTDTDGTLWAYSGKTDVSKTLTLVPMSTHWMYNSEVGLDGGNTIYKDKFGVICDVDLTAALKSGKVKHKEGEAPKIDPASYDECNDLGFLFPKIESMNGTTHWTSDGGKDNDIDDWREEANWRVLDPNIVGTPFAGRTEHIFLASGQLTKWSYYAGSGIPEVKVNPMDVDKTGNYASKVDQITDNYGVSPTSSSFKELGVGYQIFVTSFRDSDGDGYGDIRGIIDSLDYFTDLGVDCLWLTPIQQSDSYHGYDISDYYAVDKRYGTIDDYRELIYKAHQRGIKVLMDLVLNHTSKNNIWFNKSQWGVNSGAPGCEKDSTGINWRNVYTWKFRSDKVPQARRTADKTGIAKPVQYDLISVEEAAKDPYGPSWYRDGESNYYYYGKFGSSMPEINYENKDTRKLVTDMAKYWLSFGLDGFRLDAVKHIYMKDEVKDTGSDYIVTDVGSKRAYDEEKGQYIVQPYDYSSDMTKNVAFWKEFSNELKKIYPDCFLVGENFDGYGNRVAPYFQGLDSQFDFANYYHVPSLLMKSGANVYGQTETNEVINPARADSTQIDVDGRKDTIPGGKRGDFIDGAFTSNHDVMRAINQANATQDPNKPSDYIALDNVTGTAEQIRKAKVQAAATILHQGLSWIYYGDELGMSSNTNTHIDKYHNENNMDIWYRQPFMWNDSSVRANYVKGEYKFEFDSYNASLCANGKGITYTNGKVSSTNEMYAWYKGLCEIKNMYPKNANVDYSWSGDNVLTFHVTGQGSELVIYFSTGFSTSEYRLNPGDGFTKVKEMNCSGKNIGDNFTESCAIVAYKK